MNLGYLALAFADRLRGHPGILPPQVKRVIEAGLVAWCAGFRTPEPFAVVTTLTWAGICLGSYGNAIGPALDGLRPARYALRTKSGAIVNPGPEWWQVGALRGSAWLSLIVVGLIWGAPALLALKYSVNVALIPVAFAVAFPASCWLAYRYGKGSWATQQYLFGTVVALILAFTEAPL